MARARVRRLATLVALVPLLAAARGGVTGGSRADDAVRLPSLVIDAEARAIITVQVPVPESMRDLVEVHYAVRPLNGAGVVGGLGGVYDVQRSSSRALLLTLRVPTDVAAGELDVADVEFRAVGRPVVVQPVTVRIPLRRLLTVSGTSEVVELHSGDLVDLVFRLHNQGNANEALTVAFSMPGGWRSRPPVPRTIALPRGEEMEIATTVRIPEDAGIGDYAVLLEARSTWPPNDSVAVSYRTTLRVHANRSTVQGLMLTPVVAAASSSDGGAAFVGATLEGPVSEGMSIRARLLPRARSNGIVAQGLGSVGAYAAPFSASLSGRDWQVDAGNALMQLSDLAGLNVIGEGVTAHGERAGWEGRAVIARPAGGAGARGQVVGAGLWRELPFGRVGGAVSYLAEQGGFSRGRDLTALAADYTSVQMGPYAFDGGLALRESFGRWGAGVTAGGSRETDRDRVSMRLAHTPGGSAAFARATDEFQLSGSRTLSERWSVDGSLQQSRDANNVFRALRSSGYTLGQRFQLSSTSAVSLRGQWTSFDARSASGGFGSFGAGSRDLTAGYDLRRGLLTLSGEASLGAMSRRTELLGGRSDESVAAQRGMRVFGSRLLEDLGAVDASLGVQFTQAGVGVPGDVWVASARWGQIPIVRGRQSVRLDTELQYQRLGDIQSFVVMRAGVTIALPGAMELALSAERNPYYRDAVGRSGWIAAMRLSGATMLRAASANGELGVVYSDLNGNGRRDVGEAGVSGVVLRRGEARAVSDREGRYRLPARNRGRVRVDQASLPAGMLAHPLLSMDTLERRDIPLLSTGTVQLDLRLAAGDDGRTPTVSLKEARVVLRDATGFEWVGRAVTDSSVVFEDIPAGEYVPRFDFSSVGEPLRHDDGLVILVAPRERRTVVVPLRGRAVRIITPPSRMGRQGRQQ